ncbi:hypothetical protein BG000_000042 [Podila horticola]|nr:hypothetical protein BG000_000042 [Podila horticola]
MKLAISKEPKDPVRRRLTLDQVSATLTESPSHSEVVRIPEKDNDDDVHGTKLEKRGNNSCPRGMRVRISPRAVNRCNPAYSISIGRDEPFKVQSGKWLDITQVVRANSKGDAIQDGYMAVYLDKEVVIDVQDLVLLKNGHDPNNWMRSSPEASTSQEAVDQEGSDVDKEDTPETLQEEDEEENKMTDRQASMEDISSRISEDETSRRSESEESQRPSQDYNQDEDLTNDNEDSSSNVHSTEPTSRKKSSRSKKKKTTKPTSVTGGRYPRRMTRSQAAKVTDDAPESSDMGDSDSASVEYSTNSHQEARNDRRRSSSTPRRSVEVQEEIEIETRIVEKIQESQALVEELEGQKEDGEGLYPDPSAYTFSPNLSGDDKDIPEEKEEMDVDEEIEEEAFASGQDELENSVSSDIAEASFESESMVQDDEEEESPDTIKYYPDESAAKGIDIVLGTQAYSDREEASQEVGEEEIEYISDDPRVEFAEEIQEVVQDVDEIVEDVAEDVENIIENATDDVEEIIEDVVDDVEEIIEDAAEEFMEYLQAEVEEIQNVDEQAPTVTKVEVEDDEEMPDVFKDVNLTPVPTEEAQVEAPVVIATQSPVLEVVHPLPKSLLEENWLPKERRNPVDNVELLALFFARKRGHILTSTQARYCNEMIDEATTPTTSAIKSVSSRRISSTHTPVASRKTTSKGRISRKVVVENIDCLASFFATIVKQGVLLTAKHAEYCKELIDKVTDHIPSSDKPTTLTLGSWSGADDEPSDHILSLAKFFAEKKVALTQEEAVVCKEMIDRSTTGAEDSVLSEEISEAYLDSIENVDFLAKYFAEKRGHLLSPKEASYCKTLISRSVKESPPEKILVSLDNMECLAAFFARKRGQLMTPMEAEFSIDMIRESIMPSDADELKQAQDRVFPAPTWHERALDDLLPFDPNDTEPSLNNLEWLSVFCRRRKDQLLTHKQAELCKRFIDDTTKDINDKKKHALEGFHNVSVTLRQSTSSSTQTDSTEFRYVAPTKTDITQKSSKPLAPPMDEYLEISKYQGVEWDDLPRSVRVKRFLQWHGKEPPEIVWQREQEARVKAREETAVLRAQQKADKASQDTSPLKRSVEESNVSQEQEEQEQRSVKKAATAKTKEALEEPTPGTSVETPIETARAPLSAVAKKLLEIAGNKDDDDVQMSSEPELSESVKPTSTAAILLSKVDSVKPIEPSTTKTNNLFTTFSLPTIAPSSSFSTSVFSAPPKDKSTPVIPSSVEKTNPFSFTAPKLDTPKPASVPKESKPFDFSSTPFNPAALPVSTFSSRTDTIIPPATTTKENPFVFVPHSFSPVVTNTNITTTITTTSGKARTEAQITERIDPMDSRLFEFTFDGDISDTESSYPLADMEDCEDDMEGYISPMSSP